jgi:uncharacterized protein with HEPN domain
MIAFAEKVLAYSEGLDQQAFIAGGLNYDATVCRKVEFFGLLATMRVPTIGATPNHFHQ